MDVKILRLTLKKKWFDLIKSGEKLEEYREIKQYWISRLCEKGCKEYTYDIKRFTHVLFTNGYRKDSETHTREIRDMTIGTGIESWGATPNEQYFVIKLGSIA